MAAALLTLLALLAGILLALRLGQHAQVMFRMLLEILRRHAVIGQLRVAGQLVVLVDDLLRRAATLPSGPDESNTRLTILPTERLRFPLDRERFFDDLMCKIRFQLSWVGSIRTTGARTL
jgi:hypothetical protein